MAGTKNTDMETVLRRRIERELARGDSTNNIAKQAGVPQPVLHRFLKGGQGLRVATAQKLADLFGLRLRG